MTLKYMYVHAHVHNYVCVHTRRSTCILVLISLHRPVLGVCGLILKRNAHCPDNKY